MTLRPSIGWTGYSKNRAGGSFSSNHSLQPETNTKTRLCVVFAVVNMLAYFEPASTCHLRATGLLIAPLPAKEQLWDAVDEVLWRTERDKADDVVETTFALAVNGELVRLNEPKSYCDDPAQFCKVWVERSTVSWHEWCLGMDGLNGLVMLAAALAE